MLGTAGATVHEYESAGARLDGGQIEWEDAGPTTMPGEHAASTLLPPCPHSPRYLSNGV